MKKKIKKLQLNRETLSNGSLAKVGGASRVGYCLNVSNVCPGTDCSTCNTTGAY